MTLERTIVLFEDQHLAVVSKPSGLLTQSDASGVPSLVDEMRIHFGRHYVGLIHRLDRNVSGAVLIAKRSKSAARLSEQLRTGKICRFYRAWVQGVFTHAPNVTLQWQDHHLKNPTTNQVTIRREPFSDSKPCSLEVKALEKRSTCSLLEYQPLTGRSHQIRAQSAFHGFPILGDSKYGSKSSPPSVSSWNRPLLHCFAIQFDHPMSGQSMRIEAPLPLEMARPPGP